MFNGGESMNRWENHKHAQRWTASRLGFSSVTSHSFRMVKPTRKSLPNDGCWTHCWFVDLPMQLNNLSSDIQARKLYFLKTSLNLSLPATSKTEHTWGQDGYWLHSQRRLCRFSVRRPDGQHRLLSDESRRNDDGNGIPSSKIWKTLKVNLPSPIWQGLCQLLGG